MSDETSTRTPAPPALYLVIGLLIIPLNYNVWNSPGPGPIVTPLGDHAVAFTLLAALQLVMGVSAAVGGVRRWRGDRKVRHLVLAAGGVLVALGAIGGYYAGSIIPPVMDLHV